MLFASLVHRATAFPAAIACRMSALLVLMSASIATPSLAQDPEFEVVELRSWLEEAVDLNNSGAVLGRSGESVVVWQDGETFVLVDGLPVAINDDGDIIGFAYAGNRYFLWTEADGFTYFDENFLRPRDIGIGPQIVGRVVVKNYLRSALWQNGARTLLEQVEENSDDTARAINNVGQSAGDSYTSGGVNGGQTVAVRWNGTSPTVIGSNFSRAYAINDHGVAVGVQGNPNHAHVWPGGDIGVLPGDDRSMAWAVNNLSWVVGQSIPGGGFLWRAGAMEDLNDLVLSEWEITDAYAVNDDGWILAEGFGPVLLKPACPGLVAMAGLDPEARSRITLALDCSADIRWRNAVDGDFDAAANWLPEAVPEEDHVAVFVHAAGEEYTVTLRGPHTTLGLRVAEGQTVRLAAEGTTYTVGIAAIGGTGEPTLDLVSGTLRCTGDTVIGEAGTTGTLVVSPDAAYEAVGNLMVGAGSGGSGSLDVAERASVSCDELEAGDGGGFGVVTVSGADSSLTAKSATVGGGIDGHGVLIIEGGGAVDVEGEGDAGGMILGFGLASSGEVIVGADGTSSTLHLGEGGFVGFGGRGTMTIRNGRVTSLGDLRIGGLDGPEDPSVVTVEENGELSVINASLVVGDEAPAEMTVRGSAFSSDARVGRSSGGDGTVTVTGAGAEWTLSGELRVGVGGHGVLNIEGGGAVDVGEEGIGTMELGFGNASSGEVIVGADGTSGTLTLGDEALVGGEGGRGTMTIRNGRVTTGGLFLLGLRNPGGEPSVLTVEENGELRVGSALLVGDEAPAEMTVRGSVFSRDAWVGRASGGDGTVTVTGAGAEWIVSDQLRVGLLEGTGLVRVENGGLVACDSVVLGAGGQIDAGGGILRVLRFLPPAPHGGAAEFRTTALIVGGTVTAAVFEFDGGTLGGDGTFSFDVTNNGLVAPGNGFCDVATFNIDGDYVQETAGTLVVEMRGTAPEDHDALAVTGNVTLGGTLRLLEFDGYAPQANDAMTIITTSGGLVTGEFDAIDACADVNVAYEDDRVVVTFTAACVEPTCPADIDDDGLVSFQDLIFVLTAWGECQGCREDLDGDCDVDFTDLIVLLSNWGPCP